MGGIKEGSEGPKGNGPRPATWGEHRKPRLQELQEDHGVEDHQTERTVERDYGTRDVPEQEDTELKPSRRILVGSSSESQEDICSYSSSQTFPSEDAALQEQMGDKPSVSHMYPWAALWPPHPLSLLFLLEQGLAKLLHAACESLCSPDSVAYQSSCLTLLSRWCIPPN